MASISKLSTFQNMSMPVLNDIYTGGIGEKIKLPFYERNWIKNRNHINPECNFLMNRIDGIFSGQG